MAVLHGQKICSAQSRSPQPFCRNQDRFMNDSWEGLGVAGMDDNNIFRVVKIQQ